VDYKVRRFLKDSISVRGKGERYISAARVNKVTKCVNIKGEGEEEGSILYN